ncbi:hypothetical protein BAAM0499_02310 [Bifidobacterium animalis subsp. animalis MCC 0499]|nr:hypothetical protein BAAA27672_03815 [Bifidobacterium animalis subsp. animalis ATCC 27672]KOA60816.1 hypothetical protein BAAM0499_02310 [Bifidobacterium animalis subsp. animalis MCC 0499]
MHSFGSAAKLMEFNNNRPEGSTYEMSLARMPESAVMLIPPCHGLHTRTSIIAMAYASSCVMDIVASFPGYRYNRK